MTSSSDFPLAKKRGRPLGSKNKRTRTVAGKKYTFKKKAFKQSNTAGSNPKAPDYRGKILLDLSTFEVINGTITVELAGWKQTAKSGLTYLQIKAQKPREQQAQPQQTKAEELDDDIEF